MSPSEIKYLLFGLIPLSSIALWLRMETKGAGRSTRVGSGLIAGVSFSLWLLSLSNSLGSYYDGMREHRVLHSLIRAYPVKTTEIDAWASGYKFYRDFDYHVTKLHELEAVIETDR